MSRVEIRRDGVILSCLDVGSARDVVVLLHGLAGSAREMWQTAESLLPARRVIAIDQRGHGHSTRRPGDLSRSAYVDDVAAVIDRLADGGPVTLVGQSMGGHTAMLTAARYPGLVSRLVMLEAGVGGRAADDDYPARLGDWFASWPVPFADERAAAGFLGSTPIARSWLCDLERRADGLWPRFEPEVMRAAIEGVAERARWEEWREVRAPTLLAYGGNGTTTAAEVIRMLELRPGVAHAVIPDAGHDVHLERPGEWARLLGGFLGSPDRGPVQSSGERPP